MHIGRALVIPLTTGVISFGVGLGVGYQIGLRKNIKAQMDEVRREMNEDNAEQFRQMRATLGIPEEDEETDTDSVTEEWVPAANFEDTVETTATEETDDGEDVKEDEGGEPDVIQHTTRELRDRIVRESRAQGREVVWVEDVEDPVEKARLEERSRWLFGDEDDDDEDHKQKIAPFKEGLVFKSDPIVRGNVRVEESEEPVDKRMYDENGILAETEPDGWNYSQQVRLRTETAPYILHADEFFSNERDYVQSTFTYYSGDDVMLDEDDTPVHNHKQVVGEFKFGFGSGDPNVCYVRNPVREAEYEILNDSGSYTEEILGIHEETEERSDPEIRHSVRKFRQSD